MRPSEGTARGALAGQVAVVTGASRGIGAAIAQRLAREGAHVVATARSAAAVRQLTDQIRESGGRASPLELDVRHDDSVAAFGTRVRELAGPPSVIVNNAGVMAVAPFIDTEMSVWSEVMDVNLFGAVRVTREFLPAMQERGTGRVINVASTAGKYGSPFQSAYNASKHALLGLTKCVALEVAAAGVRVNAICPGFVSTDMVNAQVDTLARLWRIDPSDVMPTIEQRVPVGRLVRPEEVAEMAAYLAHPLSDAVTGVAFTLAGGMLLI